MKKEINSRREEAFCRPSAFYIRDDRCFYLYFCDYGGSRNITGKYCEDHY